MGTQLYQLAWPSLVTCVAGLGAVGQRECAGCMGGEACVRAHCGDAAVHGTIFGRPVAVTLEMTAVMHFP